jgi:hypothetical protein
VNVGDQVSIHYSNTAIAGYGEVQQINVRKRSLTVKVTTPFVSDSGVQYRAGTAFISGVDMFLPVSKLRYTGA